MIRRLHVPVTRPEDVQPHLGDPQLHWRTGFSAQELAYCWHSAGTDFPPAVRATLNTAPEYLAAELVDGFFEREVALDTNRANSQTDLMVVTGLQSELAIIAIEGKVDESFDKMVCEWNTSPTKNSRLEFLCEKLELSVGATPNLRYQLLHRTYSALREAERYRCRHALMMVHSFSRSNAWFQDFQSFSAALGLAVEATGICSEPRICRGISLRLAWTSDDPIPRSSANVVTS